MSETRTVFDPFELKTVEISNRLVDRLRGKYASGPHIPNGKPEFGWRQFQAPPIQHEAADALEAKDAEILKLTKQLEEARAENKRLSGGIELMANPEHWGAALNLSTSVSVKVWDFARALLNGSAK